jgi:hypothetical protein
MSSCSERPPSAGATHAAIFTFLNWTESIPFLPAIDESLLRRKTRVKTDIWLPYANETRHRLPVPGFVQRCFLGKKNKILIYLELYKPSGAEEVSRKLYNQCKR